MGSLFVDTAWLLLIDAFDLHAGRITSMCALHARSRRALTQGLELDGKGFFSVIDV
jgi:hypothetical protein